MALRPWLELIRLPAVFTAPADVLCGLALAGAAGAVAPWWAVAAVIVASACVYCAGMAANDLFDATVDAVERPGRPIPSGRISRGGAWALVITLQLLALGLGALIGVAALCAVAGTIAATWLYDAVLKDSPLGPLAMGLCRYGNALLGVCAAAGAPGVWWLWAVPATTALYVAALTFVSRHEVDGATRAEVILPATALWLAAALPALWAMILPERWAAVAILLPLGWLFGPWRAAIGAPSAGRVRGLVMAGIFGIAMVNAVIALLAGGYWQAGVAVGLLVPGRLVGRWFYAT